MLPKLLLVTLLFELFSVHPAIAQEESRFEFSGFARIVGGYLNDENQTYNGYNNSVSLRNQSLLGLRGDVNVSDSVSIVGQAILRANENQDSEIQWLYIDYRPTNALSFKFGRQRIPLYQYSEIIDVGFAYPWISLPQEVYSPFIFNDYDGVLGSYEFSTPNLFGSVDAYYGIYDGDVSIGEQEVGADVSNLMGLSASVQVNQFNFRASYHKANVEVLFDDSLAFQKALNQLGFFDSASVFTVDHKADYFQLSAGWENLDYFARFEYTGFDSAAYFIPQAENFYLSLGYNFSPYTVHVTFAQSITDYGDAPNDIPVGISPGLDYLAQQFQLALQSKPIDDRESINLGLRYELRANIALKADVTFLKGQLNAVQARNTYQAPYTVSESTELVQFAVEWVF